MAARGAEILWRWFRISLSGRLRHFWPFCVILGPFGVIFGPHKKGRLDLRLTNLHYNITKFQNSEMWAFFTSSPFLLKSIVDSFKTPT